MNNNPVYFLLRAVIFVGQLLEAVCMQFFFLMKMWVGPNGEHPLSLKDEGTGTMHDLNIHMSRTWTDLRAQPQDSSWSEPERWWVMVRSMQIVERQQ
jgi:hypothetical protein